jgi:general stress protein YciG
MANNIDTTDGNQDNRSKGWFASMEEEKQREIASKGGKAAHEKGTAHEFDSEEGKEVGRRGQAKHNPSSGTYGIDCLDTGNNMLDNKEEL